MLRLRFSFGSYADRKDGGARGSRRTGWAWYRNPAVAAKYALLAARWPRPRSALDRVAGAGQVTAAHLCLREHGAHAPFGVAAARGGVQAGELAGPGGGGAAHRDGGGGGRGEGGGGRRAGARDGAALGVALEVRVRGAIGAGRRKRAPAALARLED